MQRRGTLLPGPMRHLLSQESSTGALDAGSCPQVSWCGSPGRGDLRTLLVASSHVRQTGRVATVDLSDWASVVAIIAGVITTIGVLSRRIDSLDKKVNGRIDRLDTKLDTRAGELDTKIDTKVDGLDAKISALDTKLDTKVGELDTKISALDMKLDTKIDGLRSELAGRFDETNARLQAIEQRTYDLSQRLPATSG